jgi:hypothetical protein
VSDNKACDDEIDLSAKLADSIGPTGLTATH